VRKVASEEGVDHSLAGVRVLVGRARHQAGALSAELRRLGATVIEIPFIEIRKPRSFEALDAALKNLADYDWLILTSANGVEAMWRRISKLRLRMLAIAREVHDFSRPASRLGVAQRFSAANHANGGAVLAAAGPRVAAIGPATKRALEQRGIHVDVVPKEYVAESVVRSLKDKVKGQRVLLVRAKVARDVIPRELRKAGALIDVVEAYETVVPEPSRRRLNAVLKSPLRRPHVVTFTSSSTVRNFVELLGGSRSAKRAIGGVRGQECPRHTLFLASIGPVTSSTLRELGLKADIAAKEYTIPGLVAAIVGEIEARKLTR
jgi:uroporphyrinogen-III synthase